MVTPLKIEEKGLCFAIANTFSKIFRKMETFTYWYSKIFAFTMSSAVRKPFSSIFICKTNKNRDSAKEVRTHRVRGNFGVWDGASVKSGYTSFYQASQQRVAVELRLNSGFSYFLSAKAWKKVSKKALSGGGKNSPRAPELLRSVSTWNGAKITEMQLQRSKWSNSAAYGAKDSRFWL